MAARRFFVPPIVTHHVSNWCAMHTRGCKGHKMSYHRARHKAIGALARTTLSMDLDEKTVARLESIEQAAHKDTASLIAY
jgi:hypothetical protein